MRSEPPRNSPRHSVPTSTVAAIKVGRRGERLGAYFIEEPLADGSMGRVYRASHHSSGQKVAIKVLHPEVAKDEVAVERFRREYDTARALSHQHIVKVLDFGGTDDGAHYMAMEYLEGEELSVVLEREGALKPAKTVRILCQLALGLRCAHASGVVHRDLKPDNVFVCSGDQVRILDFGSVKLHAAPGRKLTMLGTTLGSPCYMSPEQAAGATDVDQRTDVFALAAILHELATGTVAFAGDDVSEILMKVVGEEAPPVSASNHTYPWAFDDVVKRGLHKDKTKRFETVTGLAEAMLSALGLEPDVARWARATPNACDDALARRSATNEIRSQRSSRACPSSVPAPPTRRANLRGMILLGGLGVVAVFCIAWAILA